ncbi:DUF2637 domain-containing protein [Nonomuraea endophytica]|uniref:DUF2637 domain-containing protein n=1 Tax=Nonomuraea endophytica TaxID=714136 RepID=UPI0037CCAB1D
MQEVQERTPDAPENTGSKIPELPTELAADELGGANPASPAGRRRWWQKRPALVIRADRREPVRPAATTSAQPPAASPAPSSATLASPAGDRRIRTASIATILIVAIVGTAISSWHAYELVRSGGEPAPVALGYPFLIDGVIFMASMVVLMYSRRGQRAPLLAWVALILGALITLAVNVAQAWDGGALSRLVSAIPPLAVIGSYELLMKQIRLAAADAVKASAEEPASHPQPPAEEVAEIPPTPAPVARTLAEAVLALRATGEPIRAVARAFDIPRSRVEAIIRQAEDGGHEAAYEPADAEVDELIERLRDDQPPPPVNGTAVTGATVARSGLGGGV